MKINNIFKSFINSSIKKIASQSNKIVDLAVSVLLSPISFAKSQLIGRMKNFLENVQNPISKKILAFFGHHAAQPDLSNVSGVKSEQNDALDQNSKQADENDEAHAPQNPEKMKQLDQGITQCNKSALESEKGDANTQYNFGKKFQIGKGVKKDYKKALEHFKKAELYGHVGALIELGKMYQLGKGVTQDNNQAYYYYQKAAEKGDTQAKNLLVQLQKKLPS